MTSPSDYLLPFDKKSVTKEALKALEEVESQFYLSKEKLEEIVDQFLVEYKQGLEQKVTQENKDTFV